MEKMMLTVLVSGLLVGSLCPAFGADVTSSEGWVDPILTPGMDAVAWTEVTASPTPTGRSAIGWIGDYVYLFGNESYPTVALYWHVPTETWGNSTPHPSGSSDNWTGTVLGGELYVLGRYNMSHPTNEFWKFTPDGSGTGTWVQLANYPMNICMLALAADEACGVIYAAGGYDGGSGTASAYRYDVIGDSWTPIGALPEARLCIGGAVVNNKFYAVGGLETGSYTYTNTLYEYDPGSASWSTKANLPQAVAFNWSSVTAYGGNIYQVGGGGGYGSWPALSAVQVYDPATDTWSLETSLPAANGTNSATLVMGIEPYLVSTGGWSGSQYVGQTFKGTGLPVIPVTLVTGGGWIPGEPPGPGNKRTFGFNAHSEAGSVWGQLQFNDHALKMQVHSDTLRTLVVQPGDTIANFSGDCRVDGVGGYTFDCEVMDRGEPGHYVDWFSVDITGPGGFNYSAGNFLGGGNIQVHTSPGGKLSKDDFSKGRPGWKDETQKGPHLHLRRVKGTETLTSSHSLSHNSPNPFFHSTTIRFFVGRSGALNRMVQGGGARVQRENLLTRERINLSVYDLTGRLVRTLIDGEQEPGYYSVSWDGKDSSGREVAGGIYLCRLTVRQKGDPPKGRSQTRPFGRTSGHSGDHTVTKKLIVLR